MKHVLMNVEGTVYEQHHTMPFDQLNQRKDDGAVTDAGIGHLRETKVGVVWNLIFNKEKDKWLYLIQSQSTALNLYAPTK